jgi:hypothetical protein
MTAIPSGGNYMSDAEIMAWVAQKQSDMYGDLSKAIDVSQDRAHFTEDLNNIKADLRHANETNDFSKVDGELQAFMSKYGSDPNFAEACQGIDGIANEIHSGGSVQRAYVDAHVRWQTAVTEYDAAVELLKSGSGTLLEQMHAVNVSMHPPGDPPQPPGSQHYSDSQMDAWKDLISGKIDDAGHNDQLNMIHVQDVKGQIDQSTQLASALISGSQKASEGILHNIA